MRPIDGDELLEAIQYRQPIDSVIGEAIAECVNITRNIINAAPTLDLEPVRHGRWIPRYEKMRNKYETVMIATEFSCSVCGIGRHSYRWNYCPTCGAKMDLEVQDD
jgi:hypothetical protein